MSTNRRVILAERPRYIGPTASCFRMDEGPMPPEPQEGEVRVRTLWLAMESTLYSKVQPIIQLQRDPVKLKDPMVGSAVVPLLNINARIAAVGQTSTAHIGEDSHHGRCQKTRTFMQEVISRRLTVRGLIASDHVKGRVKKFDTKMKGWIAEGRVRPMEDIVVGLDNAPDAFQGVFEGRNRGTRLVKVAD